ncbi:MAG: hypothetical protein HQL16_01100 [Candidatus Omnitrophica bacterium]|nr:hypothetical protein [Candidatus Omnitrophota bacterium]
MDRLKILFFSTVVVTLCACLWGVGSSQAAPSSPAGEQVSQRHDTDAIIQRKLKRITPEQRATAAANAAKERVGADPAAIARRAAVRTAIEHAQAVRIQALQDPLNSAKSLRAATSLEAAARREEAQAAKAIDVKTLGGANE